MVVVQLDAAVKAFAQQRRSGVKPVIADPDVNSLLGQLQIVGGKIGFDEARSVMRGHGNGMLLAFGPAHIFMTINWSDLSNLLVLYFLGFKVDLNVSAADLPVDLPSLRERAVRLAQNPIAAARFFHTAVRSFLK